MVGLRPACSLHSPMHAETCWWESTSPPPNPAGGRCPDSIEKGRWIPTLAATYLGQNLSVLITPGSEPNKVRSDCLR